MKKLFVLLLLGLSHTFLFAQSSSFGVNVIGNQSTHAILIPGFACGGTVWDATVEQLQSSSTCHVLTLAGFAGQQKITNPSLKDWTADIAEYIQQQNLGRVTLIGHSMGGMLSLQLAAKYPSLIEKIVVIDALPCLAALSNPQFQANPTTDCTAMVDLFTQQTAEQFAQRQRASVVGMSSSTDKHETIVQWAIDSDKATLGAVFCELMQTDLRPEIANITCPALILLEANFKSLNSVIEKQYASLSRADLRYANQGLHFIMYDDPTWQAAQLSDFLNPKLTEK